MDYNLESVACAICKNVETELISKKGQFDLPLNVVLCKKCGLGYLNPRWDKKGYADFYKNEYDKFYRPEITTEFKVENPDSNIIIKRLKQSQMLPNTLMSILDIGSGAGKNLLSLGQLYPKSNLFAIEPSMKSQKILKDNGVSILSNDIDSNWENQCDEKFDLIIMRHVLEHFLDPISALKKVEHILNTNGIVYLAVPNNLNPTANLDKSWFRVVHTYYFNKYSLHNLFALTGLKILKLVEGDLDNRGEVFLVATKTNVNIPQEISTKHFEIQKQVFLKKRRKENSFIRRVYHRFRKK